MQKSFEKQVESQANLLVPFIAGVAGDATGELVGDAITQKGKEQINKTTPETHEGPSFSKNHTQYLTHRVVKDKEVQRVLENFLNQNPSVSAQQVDSLLSLLVDQAGMPPLKAAEAMQIVFQSLSTMQSAGDAQQLLADYADILTAFLKANPENIKGAIEFIKNIITFEQQNPIFNSMPTLKPSRLAVKKILGGDITPEIITLRLAAISLDPTAVIETMSRIDQLERVVSGGEVRSDKWGLQETMQTRLKNQRDKERAYEQSAKVVMQFERWYNSAQSEMTKALSALGIPSLWAGIATSVLAPIAFVRNLGNTVTGGNPVAKVAFYDGFYRMAQNAEAPQELSDAPDSYSAQSTLDSYCTDKNLASRVADRLVRVMQFSKIIQGSPLLAAAPSVDTPIPMNILKFGDAKTITEASKQMQGLAQQALDQIKFVKDNLKNVTSCLGVLNESERSLLSSLLDNSVSIDQFQFQVQDALASLAAIQISYPASVKLFNIERQLAAQQKAAESFMGFQGTGLNLPAINTERIIQILLDKKRLYDSVQGQYLSASQQFAPEYFTALAQTADTEAQSVLAEVYKYMQSYVVTSPGSGALVSASVDDSRHKVVRSLDQLTDDYFKTKNINIDAL